MKRKLYLIRDLTTGKALNGHDWYSNTGKANFHWGIGTFYRRIDTVKKKLEWLVEDYEIDPNDFSVEIWHAEISDIEIISAGSLLT